MPQMLFLKNQEIEKIVEDVPRYFHLANLIEMQGMEEKGIPYFLGLGSEPQRKKLIRLACISNSYSLQEFFVNKVMETYDIPPRKIKIFPLNQYGNDLGLAQTKARQWVLAPLQVERL